MAGRSHDCRKFKFSKSSVFTMFSVHDENLKATVSNFSGLKICPGANIIQSKSDDGEQEKVTENETLGQL